MAEPLEPTVLSSPEGEVTPVAPEDVADLAKAGYRPANPAQIADYELAQQREAQYGGVKGGLIAGAQGAASGLTLGLSDLAFSPNPAWREVNPTAFGAGEVAGVVAPSLLTGGTAGAAELGAKGALRTAAEASAPSIISKVGRAAESGVAKVLGEGTGLGGQLVRKATAKAAGNAVEGAFYSAGHVVSEEGLGDPNLTAESAISEIGMGALLGGGLGTLAGVGEVAVPAAVAKAKLSLGSVFDKSEGLGEGTLKRLWQKEGIQKDVGDYVLANKDKMVTLSEKYPEVAKALPYSDLKTVQKVMEDQELALRDPIVRGELQKSIGKSVENMVSSVEDAYKHSHKAIEAERARLVEEHLGRSSDLATAEGTRLVDSMSEAVNKLKAEKDLYHQGMARTLEQMQEGLSKRLGEGVAPAELSDELLKTRKLLDDIIPRGPQAKMMGFQERETVKVLNDVRTQLKESLTNENVWGKAAGRTSALNEAQSELIEARKALFGQQTKAFDAKSTKLLQYAGDEIKSIPSKIKTWLNQAVEAGGQVKNEALDAYMTAGQKLVKELEESHLASGVKTFDRQGLESLISKTGDQISAAKQQAEVTAVMQRLDPKLSGVAASSSTQQGLVAGLGALGAAPVAEHMVSGLGPLAAVYGAGKAAYHAVESMKSVPKAVATLAQLERIGQTVSKHIDTATSTAIRAGVRASYVGRGEAAAGIASVFGKEDPSKQYAKRRDQINRLAQNPELLTDALSKTGDLSEHAPKTTQAIQMTGARGVAFLASKLPQHPASGPLASKWEPSKSEISTFNRYYEAVERPQVILKQAAAGTLTAEAVEAVKAVYPSLFAQIQAALVDKMTEHSKSMPYRARLMTSMILGQDLDGTTTPASIRANQQVFGAINNEKAAANTPAPPSGASHITLSSRYETPSQASIRRSQR